MNKGLFKKIDYFFERHRSFPIIIIIVILFLTSFIPALIESTKSINKEDYSRAEVVYAVNLYSDLLEFNDENKEVIKMDTLYQGFTYDGGNYSLSPIYNDEFDQCAGYVIVTKVNDTIDIDTSHMCDMIDY